MIEASPELLAFLKEEEVRSRNEDLLDRAEVNLRSYKGEYYGDEVDGRSKAVSRDVAEVIDHMEVSVLRTFVSGDRVVEFEPLNDADEQAADDATEVMQRDFQRKGYRLLHDWFKEGNLSVLGVVKACYEKRTVKREATLPELLLGEVENIVSKKKAGSDPTVGDIYNVTYTEDKLHFEDRLVPLEEFRISPDAYCVEDAVYLAHAVRKSVSDLVEMGFDRESVETAHDETARDTSLAQTRSSLDYYSYGPDRAGALRQVMLLEEYVRFDLDEDGIAERLCVHRVGDTVLRIEEVDYQPFTVYCPFPMPGRVDGEALAEKVTDIQRVNTVLLRNGLDGIYLSNAPRMWVPEECVTESTLDDLLTVRPGGLVRGRDAGSGGPRSLSERSDVASVAFNAIEFMIGQRESRTGITRLNQGLDADALNKTATGTALMQAQGQQMEEYLARNFAEAVASLMATKLKLYKRYSPTINMRVDGEYRAVEPSQWPDEMDIIIRVGLGTGRKEHRLQNRMTLLEIQREVMLAGLPIVGPEQIYKSMVGVIRDASLGSPADFVIDPSTIPPQEPQPSPEEMKMQGELQMAQMKMQADAMLQAAKLEMQKQEAAQKADLERQKAETDLRLALVKQQADLDYMRQKAEIEAQQAQQKLGAALDEQDAKAAAFQLDTVKAEAEANRKAREGAIKANQERQKAEADIILDQRKASADIELARAKAEAEAVLAREKAEAEIALAVAKMEQEEALNERRMNMEEDLAARDQNRSDEEAARDHNRRDYETQSKISTNRSGGKLDE